MKKSEKPKASSVSESKEFKPNFRKNTTTPTKTVLPKYGTTKRVPLTESPVTRLERIQHDLNRAREKRAKEEVRAQYEYLKNTLKFNYDYIQARTRQFTNRYIQEATKLNVEDDVGDEDDLYHLFGDSDEDDDYLFGSGSMKYQFPQRINREKKYIFLRLDSKGKTVERKVMTPKGDANPFKIELDVKGFDPEEILIDSTENRVIISMRKKTKPTKTKSRWSTKQLKGEQVSKPKAFGIICPTVDAVDKLNIYYPKDGMLLIEGPIPTPTPGN